MVECCRPREARVAEAARAAAGARSRRMDADMAHLGSWTMPFAVTKTPERRTAEHAAKHHPARRASILSAPIMRARGAGGRHAADDAASAASFDPETFPLADAKAEAAEAFDAERRALHRRLAATAQALDEERRDHDHDGRIQTRRLPQSLQHIEHLNDEMRAAREAPPAIIGALRLSRMATVAWHARCHNNMPSSSWHGRLG
jgi:hypothetical protein